MPHWRVASFDGRSSRCGDGGEALARVTASMAAATLGLYILFLLLVGGLRAWIHYRRTGDYGIRLHAPNALTRLVGLLLLAGIILGAVASGGSLDEEGRAI
jgi:hypothetical protein